MIGYMLTFLTLLFSGIYSAEKYCDCAGFESDYCSISASGSPSVLGDGDCAGSGSLGTPCSCPSFTQSVSSKPLGLNTEVTLSVSGSGTFTTVAKYIVDLNGVEYTVYGDGYGDATKVMNITTGTFYEAIVTTTLYLEPRPLTHPNEFFARWDLVSIPDVKWCDCLGANSDNCSVIIADLSSSGPGDCHLTSDLSTGAACVCPKFNVSALNDDSDCGLSFPTVVINATVTAGTIHTAAGDFYRFVRPLNLSDDVTADNFVTYDASVNTHGFQNLTVSLYDVIYPSHSVLRWTEEILSVDVGCTSQSYGATFAEDIWKYVTFFPNAFKTFALITLVGEGGTGGGGAGGSGCPDLSPGESISIGGGGGGGASGQEGEEKTYNYTLTDLPNAGLIAKYHNYNFIPIGGYANNSGYGGVGEAGYNGITLDFVLLHSNGSYTLAAGCGGGGNSGKNGSYAYEYMDYLDKGYYGYGGAAGTSTDINSNPPGNDGEDGHGFGYYYSYADFNISGTGGKGGATVSTNPSGFGWGGCGGKGGDGRAFYANSVPNLVNRTNAEAGSPACQGGPAYFRVVYY